MAQTEGFVSDGDNTITVVLDTKLTPELIEEGFVREIISKVQTMRKEADFQVTDKIVISCKGNEKIEQLIKANADQIKSEVLAVDEVRRGQWLREGLEYQRRECYHGRRARVSAFWSCSTK